MITLPLPPSANRYWRYTRGRVLVSREALGSAANRRDI